MTESIVATGVNCTGSPRVSSPDRSTAAPGRSGLPSARTASPGRPFPSRFMAPGWNGRTAALRWRAR